MGDNGEDNNDFLDSLNRYFWVLNRMRTKMICRLESLRLSRLQSSMSSFLLRNNPLPAAVAAPDVVPDSSSRSGIVVQEKFEDLLLYDFPLPSPPMKVIMVIVGLVQFLSPCNVVAKSKESNRFLTCAANFFCIRLL